MLGELEELQRKNLDSMHCKERKQYWEQRRHLDARLKARDPRIPISGEPFQSVVGMGGESGRQLARRRQSAVSRISRGLGMRLSIGVDETGLERGRRFCTLYS